jgi:hypothetical protein
MSNIDLWRSDMGAIGLDPAGGLNFWPAALWALGVAAVLAVIVLFTVKPQNDSDPASWSLWRLGGEVNAPNAWSPQGSWTTNITAVGAILGTVAGTTGGLQQYVPNSGAFVAVSLLFGGAAVLAPIIYAALATSKGIQTPPDGVVSGALGTVAGLLLAAVFTLFGFLGELFATITVAIRAVSGQSGPEVFVWVSLLLAALLVLIYAYRSLKDMILFPLPPAQAPQQPPPEQPAPARIRPLSRLSSSPKASATL